MKESYSLADLRSWQQIKAGREKPIGLGVFGDPVAHSLSPQMQNAALKECGIALQYARFHILPNELESALRLVRELGFAGINLTVPHKRAAIAFLDKIDAAAQEIGAINTIRIDGGKLVGFNTDGPGFARAIRESFDVELRDLRVMLLGAAGGAGQAIAAQCAIDKCPRLVLVNRDLAKAQTLVRKWNRNEIVALPWDLSSLGAALLGTELIVNATPLGLKRTDPSPLPRALLAPRHRIYDLNYQPTALIAAAAEAGARSANGLTMLLHQGALAFELWFNRPAPLDTMRRALGL